MIHDIKNKLKQHWGSTSQKIHNEFNETKHMIYLIKKFIKGGYLHESEIDEIIDQCADIGRMIWLGWPQLQPFPGVALLWIPFAIAVLRKFHIDPFPSSWRQEIHPNILSLAQRSSTSGLYQNLLMPKNFYNENFFERGIVYKNGISVLRSYRRDHVVPKYHYFRYIFSKKGKIVSGILVKTNCHGNAIIVGAYTNPNYRSLGYITKLILSARARYPNLTVD